MERITWARRVADAAHLDLTVAAMSGASTIEAELLLLPQVDGHHELGLCYLGINDVKQVRIWDAAGYRERLTRCVDRLLECSDRVVVLTLPPNLGAVPTLWPYGPGMRERVRTANQIIAVLRGVEVVELPALRHRSELWADGLHPTSLGHVRMARLVTDALGLPEPDVDAEPLSLEYRRWWRRMIVQQALVRPPRAMLRQVQAMLD